MKELSNNCSLNKRRQNNVKLCTPRQCMYCGWNEEVAKEREKTKKFHEHRNGLWGY